MKLADGYAQSAPTCPDSASGIADACGPGSPDSHRVVWGLTSRPPVPPRASSGFPFARRVLPVARLPLVSRRPAFSGSSPSAVARFRFPFGVPPGSRPLSNLHGSAAAGRFRRRWSRAARAKVTSPAATPRLDLAVIRPAHQMGQRQGTMGCRHRIACYERPRAQDTAGARTAQSQLGGSGRVGLPSAAAGGFGPGCRWPGQVRNGHSCGVAGAAGRARASAARAAW